MEKKCRITVLIKFKEAYCESNDCTNEANLCWLPNMWSGQLYVLDWTWIQSFFNFLNDFNTMFICSCQEYQKGWYNHWKQGSYGWQPEEFPFPHTLFQGIMWFFSWCSYEIFKFLRSEKDKICITYYESHNKDEYEEWTSDEKIVGVPL